MIIDEDRYVTERLDEQIKWHEVGSSSAQKKYKVLTIINIIAAALVPLLTALPSVIPNIAYNHISLAVGSLGVLVTILSGILALQKYQETWVQYRSTAESLRKEKFTFLTRSNPYHREEPLALLVERVESLLASNTAQWAQFTKAKSSAVKTKIKAPAAGKSPTPTAGVGGGVNPPAGSKSTVGTK